MEGDDNESSTPGASQEFTAVLQTAVTPLSQGSCSTSEKETSCEPAWGGEKECCWNCESPMEETHGNRAGSSGNQTWDWSSESDAYISDLDSTVSDALEEELTEEHDYLRSLLQIIGKPPPFQYYTEFENAMNNPRTESSFSFLPAGVCSRKDHEKRKEFPYSLDVGFSLDRDVSSTVNSTDEGESSSLGNVSQCKKAKYSGVVSPFSTRTLSHPSFQSFYAAVSTQQRQRLPVEINGSTLTNQDSIDSCSSADFTAKSKATALHPQEINMPALHQCEFFYTDPMLPSGYRVYNHLSLPTRQMMQGLQLNTPPPIMSACVAPTNILRTVPTPDPPSLNGCQGQSRPISKAEHDAISTLLELKQCTQLDCAEADIPKCTLKNKDIHQPEVEINSVHLSANSGASGINDGNGTEQKHILFLNDCISPSLKSLHDTELHKIHHVPLPECEYSTPPHKPTDYTLVSRLNSSSSGTEIKAFDSVRSTDILPSVAQEIEIGSCDFLT